MIAMSYNDAGLSLNLAKAPEVSSLQLQKFAYLLGNHLQAAVQRNIGAGGLIGRRTGNLSRAMTFTVDVGEGTFHVEVFPDSAKVPYGAIQEFGGTIVPRTAQSLAIPLAAMLTGNGVARGSARDVMANPQAFGFKAAFIPKGKNVIMGTQPGAKSYVTSSGGYQYNKKGVGIAQSQSVDVIPLFALVKSVTIPARNYLDTTLQQEMAWIQDALEQLTGETVSIVFEGGAA